MIECIRTYHLRHKLAEAFGYSQWLYRERHALLIEVVDSSGAVGWGECYGPAAVTQSAVETYYAPLLIGLDPTKNEAAWSHCWRSSLDYARRGVMMGAMSGLDMALFDLKGKLLNVSAAELMGGRLVDRVPCYVTGMYFRELNEEALLEALLEEATGYVSQGFQALKIKVGKNLSFDQRLIRSMRERFSALRLMADSNHAFDLVEASAIGKTLDECEFSWFEEPLSPELNSQLKTLSSRMSVPIATGECEQTRWGFQDLLSRGGVHYVQSDLAYCGGPSEGVRIRTIASAQGVNVVPHVWGTQLNLACATHFIASTFVEPGRKEAGMIRLETDRSENPMRDAMYESSVLIENGSALVPSGAGLGVVPNLEAMAAFCVRKTEFH